MATIAGLSIALFGLLGVAWLTRGGGAETIRRNHAIAVAGISVMAGVVLAVVVFWEKQPLASIGLVPPTLDGVMLGAGIATAFLYVIGPLLMSLPGWFGLPGFDSGRQRVQRLPVWHLVITIILAGSAEEILLRGYGIERLALITGSLVLACILSAAASALAHVPLWGWGPVLPLFVSGLIFAVLYAWLRDLTPLIIAHVVTDMAGLVAQRRATPPT